MSESPGLMWPGSVDVTIPIRVVSEANRRDHWAAKAKRAKDQRRAAFFVLWNQTREWRAGPEECKRIVVRFSRLGPRKMDSDNLAGAFKAIRDEVAACIGIDDGDDRYEWVYVQEKNKAHAIRIQVHFLGLEAAA